MTVNPYLSAISTFVTTFFASVHPPLPQNFYRYGFGMGLSAFNIMTMLYSFLATYVIDFPYNPHHQLAAVQGVADEFFAMTQHPSLMASKDYGIFDQFTILLMYI